MKEMTSKTLLLDLPNELFPFIFQYLRSIDILKTFSDCKSRRLQALIQPFIKKLDISQESNEWVQIYLPDLFIKYDIIALCVRMKHLEFITEDILSTNIQSIEVINWDYDFDFSQEVIDRLRLNLKKLLFRFPEQNENADLAKQLFRSDSQLESFTIKNCVLYLYDEIEICTRMTYVSVMLEGMSPVFILIEHLPNLQTLKVEMMSQECIGQPEPNTNGVKPCKKLCSVTFTGWIKYFSHMERFFATFGSTIESLCLKFHLMYRIVNGTQLERGLLDKMPRLSSFDLIIFSGANYDDPIDIETFQSFTWQQFNPVVYWYDIRAQQHMLFTLPYKSDRFEYFSNDFITNCVSNRPISLSFERVRTLSLISSTPLNRETFLFIQKVFPNVTTIELTNWIINSALETDEDEEETDRKIVLINEDLLSDTSLQISSVTKFRINLWSQGVDYKTFHRFLCLFPDLVSLELDLQHPSFLRELLKYKYEDNLLEIMLAHIRQLKIVSWHQNDTLTNTEIHCLFPEATDVIVPEIYDLE